MLSNSPAAFDQKGKFPLGCGNIVVLSTYNGKTNAEQRLHGSIDHAAYKKAANQKNSRCNNMWYEGCDMMVHALSALM